MKEDQALRSYMSPPIQEAPRTMEDITAEAHMVAAYKRKRATLKEDMPAANQELPLEPKPKKVKANIQDEIQMAVKEIKESGAEKSYV